jgi:hypothetical protein
MKNRITPIGIVSIFVAMMLAQASISYSSQPVIAVQQEQQDTIPKQKKDSSMKKKNRDRDWPKTDTLNKPRRDTFPRLY